MVQLHCAILQAYASSPILLPLFPGLESNECIFVAKQINRLFYDQSSN